MKHTHYKTIAKVIVYLQENTLQQPSLEEVASAINMSMFHFQKTFNEWAGVSPKKFLQYISLQHTKHILTTNTQKKTLFDIPLTMDTSNMNRFHGLFVKIEGMTPTEYQKNGKNLTIFYNYYPTLFGTVLIGNTTKGICHISFTDDVSMAITPNFPNLKDATYIKKTHSLQTQALEVFNTLKEYKSPLKIHIIGTPFQLKVWEALLKIPLGKLNTYGDIAKKINRPKASRAVGTAIGKNPIAYLIPCHRIINTTGIIGNYMWGTSRKKAIIGWESAKTNKE